jgi:hypothetical protein
MSPPPPPLTAAWGRRAQNFGSFLDVAQSELMSVLQKQQKLAPIGFGLQKPGMKKVGKLKSQVAAFAMDSDEEA